MVLMQCTAKSKQSGQQCRRPACVGQRVCAIHGGKAPQAVAAAERRREEREALLAVETFGLPVDVDPHAALLQELHRTAGAVAWLGAVVAGLDRREVEWGLARVKEGGEDAGSTWEAVPSVWVRLWQEERRHLVVVSKACVSAGIEERRVRLAEEQGQVLAGVMRMVLDRIGLSEVQEARVPEVVAGVFREVASSGVGGGA